MIYAQDYDERYPTAAPPGDVHTCPTMKDRGSYGGWIGNLLIPYCKNVNIFECPSNPKLLPVNQGCDKDPKWGGVRLRQLRLQLRASLDKGMSSVNRCPS